MSLLTQLNLEYGRAEQELGAFKTWFAGRPSFKERDVHAELKKHRHLCLLMGFLGSVQKPDLFKHELEIGGVFRADYVAACSVTRHVTFVELEGGEANSLFGPKTTSQMRDWGRKSSEATARLRIGRGPRTIS